MATYVKGNPVANATSYELLEKVGDTYNSLKTGSEINFNLDELSLAGGQHTLVVKAKADGYEDSDYSNEVIYAVEGSEASIEWEYGSIDNNGVNYPEVVPNNPSYNYKIYLRSTDYITASQAIITIPTGKKVYLFKYDANKTYLTMTTYEAGTHTLTDIANIRLVYRNTENIEMQISDGDSLVVTL